MKPALLFLSILFSPQVGQTQIGEDKSSSGFTGLSHSVSIGALLPLGEFSETHAVGVSVFYDHSNHRFGRLETQPSKRFGFVYGAGVAWQNGKRETLASAYSYRYPDYTYVMTYAGVLFLPCRQGNIAVIAGPAVSFYSGDKRFNLFGGLTSEYFPWARIGLGGGLKFLKEDGSAWIGMAGVNLKYIF